MNAASTPATKQQLDGAVASIHADIIDLARHFNGTVGKLSERVDGLSEHVDNLSKRVDNGFAGVNTQFLEVNTKLDAIMTGEILVTRKQIERLIRALDVKGIKLNVSEILAA